MTTSAPTLIIFGSTYGHTEKYAHWLEEKLTAAGFTSVTTLPVKAVTEEAINNAEIVIVGASDYGGFLNGAPTLRKFVPLLLERKVLFFTVSFNGLVGTTQQKLDDKVIKSFTPALASQAPRFHLRGGIDHTRLTATHKTVLQGVRIALSAKLKKNEGNTQMLESYSQGVADYSDPESLEPVVDAVTALAHTK